jgi:hypothetical protein
VTATALIAGTLLRAPERRTSSTGKPYVLARLREGRGPEATWWTLFCYTDEGRDVLLRLSTGDSIAASGNFSVACYEKDGETRLNFTLYAQRVLSAHKSRCASPTAIDANRRSRETDSLRLPDGELDDDLPF